MLFNYIVDVFKIISDFLDYFERHSKEYTLVICITSGPLQTICFIKFSYVKEKFAIFPTFSSMLLLGRSCQQIISNNLMKEVWTYFSE